MTQSWAAYADGKHKLAVSRDLRKLLMLFVQATALAGQSARNEVLQELGWRISHASRQHWNHNVATLANLWVQLHHVSLNP